MVENHKKVIVAIRTDYQYIKCDNLRSNCSNTLFCDLEMLVEEVPEEFKEAASITKRVVGNWMKPTLGFLSQIGNL